MAKKNVIRKTDLIEQVAQLEGISLKDSRSIINSFLELIKGNLKEGKAVAIQQFGHFSIKEMKARKGHNPRTGETLELPARTVVSVKLSKEVRNIAQEEK